MPSHVTSPDLTPSQTALCGSVAGMIARFAIAPFDVVKIRLQVQSQRQYLPFSRKSASGSAKYTGLVNGLKVIAREEGIRGLYKGNLSAEYLYITYGATQFYAYHKLENIITALDKQQVIPTPAKAFLCGMGSGTFATTATYPFDLLRTRFAMQGEVKVYTGVIQAVKEITQTEGIRGLYWGLGPSITQIMPYMGLVFMSYDMLSSSFSWMRENQILSEEHRFLQDGTCGALAGLISKCGVFPLDVVRRRLQVQGLHRTDYVIASIPEYSRQSVLACMKAIVQKEGALALYKGLVPGLVKVGPASAINFLVFEKSKRILLYFKHRREQSTSKNNNSSAFMTL
ncbi:mitochondrial carrier domain-containing protein [Umbelopsis sp. PMI_123]|nr:mitochondrial carrier domain-containing protein [Umbelopsis sp. PMI_123]